MPQGSYKNAQIYKLCCNDLNVTDIYIGSTCNFKNRKASHKSHCNNPNDKEYNYHVYQFIREHGGWLNWSMILIEKLNNITCKQELLMNERRHYEMNNPSLNVHHPARSWNEKVTCKCGSQIMMTNRKRHERTKKHQKHQTLMGALNLNNISAN